MNYTVQVEFKREYLSYGHFSWIKLFQKSKNPWNVAILKLLLKVFFVKIFIIDKVEGGGLRGLGLREAAYEVIYRELSQHLWTGF